MDIYVVLDGMTVIGASTRLQGAEVIRADRAVRLADQLDCDAILMLPGWSNSKGAKLEYHVACSLGMHVTEWHPALCNRPGDQ